MAVSLAGKTAIITGAGSGINYHFARALLSRNCNVLLADLSLRPEAHALVAAHSTPQSPARAVFLETNVREWPQLERMFAVATKEFGGADIVCPGAGIYEPPFSSFWHPPSTASSLDPPNASRYASLDINLTHPIRTTQLALAHFLSPSPQTTSPSSPTSANPPKPPASPSHPRSIIHVTSIAAQVTPLAAPLYNASKHALQGFVRTLAPLQSRLGIRVTAVAPGVVKTPLWTENPEKLRLIDEGKDEWVGPEYVAETMVAMVSGEEVEVLGSGSGEKGESYGEGTRRVSVEGGMVVEVAKGRRRVVGQFNDPGPSGEGNTVSGMGKADRDIWESLKEGWGC